MINSQELFAPLAHAALGGEQIFRRCFVGGERIGGYIPKRVDSLKFGIVTSHQTAAFARSGFARVCEDFVGVRLLERNAQDA